ncbi:MAG: N-acetyltransferase, partial [Planctomycetes bacterium]|nr:N-acetyltransferase [Planctomycetota bacterium]
MPRNCCGTWWLARRGTVSLAQGMTAAEDPAAAAPFLEAGFVDLAVLECMERNNRRNPPRPNPSEGVEFAQAGDDDSMQSLLRSTYEETLDCPGLAELRSDADILAGHQRGGNFEPALWTVLRVEGRDAGAALLNRSPANDSIELTYLGLAKWARGKGLGSLLMEGSWRKRCGRPLRCPSGWWRSRSMTAISPRIACI